MKFSRSCVLAILAGAGCAMSTPALAEPSPALDRFSLSVGAFHAEPTLDAGLNTPYGRFDTRDIEGGSVTMPRITADVLIGDSQGFSLDYYRFNRDYGTGFANSFAIGPTSVTALGNVNLDLKLDFAKFAYKWWIGSGNTVLGLGAGVAYYRVSLDSNALAGVNGATATFSQHDSDDAFAPLLEVGVRHAISPDLRLFADVSACARAAAVCAGTSTTRRLGWSGSPSRTWAWCCPMG
jgi:hypothetical protein